MVVRLPRLPQPGESVLGGSFLMAQGGKGANQAVAASRLGAEVTLVACLGQDRLGDEAFAAIAVEGIHTDYLFREEGPSGVASIFVDETNGENCIAIAPGANAKLCREHLERALPAIMGADIILVQLEIPLSTVEWVLTKAHDHGKLTILNPAPATELTTSMLTHTTILTPNETEAQRLTGIPIQGQASAMQAAYRLREKGVRRVVITLGAQGALGVDANHCLVVAAPSVTAIDSTAAGDTFNGAFATALAQGQSLVAALTFANTAAALTVTRIGAQPSIPTLSDVEHVLHSGRQSTTVANGG